MPVFRKLLPMILLPACSGCLTNVRPTVVGQVLDAHTGRPVPGVAVSIHSVTDSERPEPLARRAGYADAIYDFTYEVHGALLPDRKPIGPIRMQGGSAPPLIPPVDP
jgi:hypothetical protein